MKSKAWVELSKWARANSTRRVVDIDFEMERKLIKQLTEDEREEYQHFSQYHRKRTESKNCWVCTECWRAMGLNDRWYHECYKTPYEPLTIFKFIAETRRSCRRATLFGIWVLKTMGLHRDCAVKIGKLVYESAWDVFLWAPTYMYGKPYVKKWKEKRKIPVKFQF